MAIMCHFLFTLVRFCSIIGINNRISLSISFSNQFHFTSIHVLQFKIPPRHNIQPVEFGSFVSFMSDPTSPQLQIADEDEYAGRCQFTLRRICKVRVSKRIFDMKMESGRTEDNEKHFRFFTNGWLEPVQANDVKDDNTDELYGSYDPSNGRAVSANHHVEDSSKTSSTEGEGDDEPTMERSIIPANSVVGDRSTKVVKVPRRHPKPHSLLPGQNRPKAYVYLGELCGDKVPSWFLPEMRFEWRQCWPRWREVDPNVQARLWNNFKNYFDLEVEESTAKHIFYRQSNKWYRRAMGAVKKEALNYAKTDNVMDLIGKEKLVWMQTQAVWDSFVQHWTTPTTMKKSESAKKSRGTQGAGQHGLGNVSLKNRMRKREEETGVRPSPFEILIEQNRKKNKVLGTDEVYNKKFEAAWGKYVLLFKKRYGQELDPMKYPPDLYIWDTLEKVENCRKKGRRLGFGTRAQLAIYNPIPQSSFASNDFAMVDLATKSHLTEEIEKRKALEEEILSLKANQAAQDASNKELREMMLNLQAHVN
ncbi:hypothetical protein LIER_29443 [Lithospermum erythrorhizon]|uniref:Transposase n=1 Tax=Lithospermum erythrorhizon TaxID=34254 RepID=A0AAV3RJ39_LITER